MTITDCKKGFNRNAMTYCMHHCILQTQETKKKRGSEQICAKLLEVKWISHKNNKTKLKLIMNRPQT